MLREFLTKRVARCETLEPESSIVGGWMAYRSIASIRMEIAVWQIRYMHGLACRTDALSSDEKERAVQFFRATDRDRFIYYRQALRCIVGHYAGLLPHAVVFSYTDTGKPFCMQPHGAPPLYFNLSHQHDLALCVVTRIGEIGVDLSCMRESVDANALVGRFFATEEQEAFAHVSDQDVQSMFFRSWTRKEAVLKAFGSSIVRIRDCVVPVSDALISYRGHYATGNDAPHPYILFDLALGAGDRYVASCAVRGTSCPRR